VQFPNVELNVVTEGQLSNNPEGMVPDKLVQPKNAPSKLVADTALSNNPVGMEVVMLEQF
jgi:hypothetical protein